MYQADINIRVRYAETDQMGYVYYGHYLTYYEVARVEAFRKLGFIYKKLERQGIMMPVLENHTRYLFPAKYDENLLIRVSIPEMPGVRVTFKYDVFNEEGQLINEGETLLAFVSTGNGKPCRPPAEMINLLKPYYDETQAG